MLDVWKPGSPEASGTVESLGRASIRSTCTVSSYPLSWQLREVMVLATIHPSSRFPRLQPHADQPKSPAHRAEPSTHRSAIPQRTQRNA
eukprot:3275259-Prymnesium_polylepis.1